MARYRSKRIVLFDGTSATSTTLTSGVHLVDDFERITVGWVDAPDASVFTIQTSFENGFDASIVSWSDVTGIVAAGVYTVDTPLRWLRALRSSSASTAEAFLQLRT